MEVVVDPDSSRTKAIAEPELSELDALTDSYYGVHPAYVLRMMYTLDRNVRRGF